MNNMPRFIKLHDRNEHQFISDLYIQVDSIERFYHLEEEGKHRNVVHIKNSLDVHHVNETPSEIKELILKVIQAY